MEGETIKKRIEVLVDNRITGLQDLKNYEKTASKLFKSLDKTQRKEVFRDDKKGSFFDQMEQDFGASQAEVIRAMKRMGLQFDEYGNVTDLVGKKVLNINKAMSDGLRKTKPFRMEYLSLMFAGMAVNRALSNVNSTALEWVGINELLSTSLGVLVLPAALDLLDNAVIPLSEYIMNLPEDIQTLIGSLSLFGQGASAAIAAFGQVGLALNGLEKFGFNISGLTNIGKKVGGYVVTGLGIAIGGYNIIKDIFFDEEGSMEFGNKIGAAIGVGVAAKSTAIGALIFSSLLAVEAIQDPAAAGKFATSIMIFIGNAIANIKGGLLALNEYIWDLLLNPKDAQKNLEENDYMQKFAKTSSDAVIEAFNNGKIETNSFVADIFNLQDEISGLSDEFDTSTDRLDVFSSYITDNAIDSLIGLDSQFINVSKNTQIATDKLNDFLKSADKLPKSKSINTNDLSWITEDFVNNQTKKYTGRAVGGMIGTTAPYLLHAGERVVPKSQVSDTSSSNINVTYNVNVADKREFEAMLERNNRQLTQNVRRLVQ